MNKVTILNREFHFGIGFLNELLDGTGLRLDELGGQDDVVLLPKMMFYSLAYASKRKGLPIESIEVIYDLIDDNGGVGGKFWTEFQIAFNNSMSKDVPVEEDKKKAEVNE